MPLKKAWKNIQQNIKDAIGNTTYDTWFSTIQVKSKDTTTLIIETPDEFFKNWILEHYSSILQHNLNQYTGSNITLEFVVCPNMIEKEVITKLQKVEKSFPNNAHMGPKLNDNFTFDNFIIGQSNRFACAASLAVSESLAKTYNPLFIYGAVGLGKTHLIQAITHKIRKIHNNIKICYISSEQFTIELINAIRNRSTQQFRDKYRKIDVLLIDDIQFIAGKDATQEEFFNTFNSLYGDHKQIILTSDKPPNHIAKLEDRLSSRFACGLIADIQPPDFETRVAILRKKIEMAPFNVSDDVIFFIAEEINTNIRELEGALIRVAAYSTLEDKPINLDIAKSVLTDMVKETNKIININTIQKTIAESFKISLYDLRSKRRNKSIVLPRQIGMYLARQLTNMSLPDIGNSFGGKDHTTVIHSCKRIEELIKTDKNIQNVIVQLTTVLKQ